MENPAAGEEEQVAANLQGASEVGGRIGAQNCRWDEDGLGIIELRMR